MKNKYLEDYATTFGYKRINPDSDTHMKRTSIYFKKVNNDCMVIEKIDGDKYVNFYLNNKHKTFKESDLLLAIMENSPVAWEKESERR